MPNGHPRGAEITSAKGFSPIWPPKGARLEGTVLALRLRVDLPFSEPDDHTDGSDPGEMARLIAAMDWSHTPLGAAEAWSPSLRMIVSFLLANRFPLLLWWGPQYISIYNDAYRPILGAKHPRSMGQPVHECWSEIWHVLQPLIDTP